MLAEIKVSRERKLRQRWTKRWGSRKKEKQGAGREKKNPAEQGDGEKEN